MSTPLLTLLALAAGGCLFASATPASLPADGGARIDVERGEGYTFRALFDGAAEHALTYRLEVIKEGTAGRSQSSQGGAFTSQAGRTDTLSTVRVNAASGDHIQATLTVSDGDDVVGRDELDEVVR